MKSTTDQIEDIKNHGYSLDFSTIFNHAFENYKKIALYAGLIILVFTFIFFIALFSIVIAYFGVESMSQDFIQSLESQKLTYIQQLFSTLAISAISGLVAPFGAGFLKMADCADKDEEFNVSTIFAYYKAPYFAQIFTASFIISLTGTAISVFFESLDLNYVGNGFSFFISYFTFFTIPLIVFGNLKALDAIKSNLIIISKNPLMIFVIFITGILGSIVGLVGCCIGIIFTIVFNTSLTYATYYSLFNMEEEDPIDSIGQSDAE
ncbi:hypothetical protein [Flavobacterium aquidurense]|uniref:hypothetical protein n=1 Tax=Flavobacterium aquidurense TaxID=362413 RepID=UPI0028573D49|nr:hypothetical protein [Flavobacterium aquidurense]MDR7372124.1 cytochrome c biogenesis factor [Flavobacterium aquidurense]